MEANFCEAGYFCDFGSLEATPRDVSGSFKYCREGYYCDEGTESEGDKIFDGSLYINLLFSTLSYW